MPVPGGGGAGGFDRKSGDVGFLSPGDHHFFFFFPINVLHSYLDVPSKAHVVGTYSQSSIGDPVVSVHGAVSYRSGRRNNENVPTFEQLLFYGNNSFRRNFFFCDRQMTGATYLCSKLVVWIRFR